MPIEINKVDTFQTRVFQSFVNLTELNSTQYPAVTTARITRYENCTTCEPLTSYSVYDQWALRTKAAS
jgi:hypothetical protein